MCVRVCVCACAIGHSDVLLLAHYLDTGDQLNIAMVGQMNSPYFLLC